MWNNASMASDAKSRDSTFVCGVIRSTWNNASDASDVKSRKSTFILGAIKL